MIACFAVDDSFAPHENTFTSIKTNYGYHSTPITTHCHVSDEPGILSASGPHGRPAVEEPKSLTHEQGIVLSQCQSNCAIKGKTCELQTISLATSIVIRKISSQKSEKETEGIPD